MKKAVNHDKTRNVEQENEKQKTDQPSPCQPMDRVEVKEAWLCSRCCGGHQPLQILYEEGIFELSLGLKQSKYSLQDWLDRYQQECPMEDEDYIYNPPLGYYEDGRLWVDKYRWLNWWERTAAFPLMGQQWPDSVLVWCRTPKN